MPTPACLDSDPEIFFPFDEDERPDLTRNQRYYINKLNKQAALKVCGGCPIRERCLEANITTPYGIFGGKTAMERRRIAEARGVIPTQHGAVGWSTAFPGTGPYFDQRFGQQEDAAYEHADVLDDFMVAS